jgi:hypothetical protein
MTPRPRITHIAPYERRRVFLQWALDGVDPSVAAPVFTIERSSNHLEDFEVIATGVTDPFYVDDIEDTDTTELNVLSQSRSLVYRVGVAITGDPSIDISYGAPADIDGNLLIEPMLKEVPGVGLVPDEKEQMDVAPHSYLYPQPKLNRRLQLLRRAKLRRTLIALRYFTGTNVAVLKRRHFGTRCEICWDPGSEMVIKSRCCACYGTGWSGGFHTPVLTMGKVVASPITDAIRTEGDVQLRQARIGLGPFPVLEKEDVIVELDNNRRWFVRLVDPVVFRSRTIKQFASCTEIGRSAVEYQVPADPENKNILAFPLSG